MNFHALLLNIRVRCKLHFWIFPQNKTYQITQRSWHFYENMNDLIFWIENLLKNTQVIDFRFANEWYDKNVLYQIINSLNSVITWWMKFDEFITKIWYLNKQECTKYRHSFLFCTCIFPNIFVWWYF